MTSKGAKRTEEPARVPHVDEATAEVELAELFLEDEAKKPRQIAIIVACVLFTVLFLVKLPQLAQQAIPELIVYVPDLETYIPPLKEPPKVEPEKVELEKVKKIPLPDPTPEEPEPIREPIPEPEPEPLPPNAKVMRGLPRTPPAAATGGPVREGMAGLVNPQKVRAPPPDYPMAARRANVGGTVFLRAIIDKQGKVTNIELVKGIGMFGLDEAAIEAVKGWEYTPGLLEGKPVEVIMTIRVEYLLK